MKVLKRLKIKNFLGTKSREVDFDLLDQLVFIVGENAGGKTTIMRAIYLALTGEDAFFGKNKLDGLINDHANEMSVELELVNKGKDYKINITKIKNKPLDIDIYENGVSLLESKLNKEAKDILATIFGNPTSILSTYFIFGDNKSDFVENTPMGRLGIITKVSDAFQKYEDISNNAKGFVKKLELEKNQKIGQLEFATKNVDELKEKIDGFNKAENENILSLKKNELTELTNCQKIKTDINNIEEQLKSVSGININEVIQKIEENKINIQKNIDINENIKKIEDEKSILSNERNDINVKVVGLDGEIKGINSNISINKGYIKDIDLDIISKFKNTLEETKDRIEKGKVLVDDKLKEGTELKSQITFKENEIKKLENEILEQSKLLNDANDLFNHNTTCPLCHNDLTEKSLTNYKKFVEGEIEKINQSIKVAKEDIEKLLVQRQNLLADYTKYNNIVKELEIYLKEIEKKDDNEKVNQKILILEKELVLKTEEYSKIKVLLAEKDILLQGLLENISKLKATLLPTLLNSEIEKFENILKLNEKTTLLEEQKGELIKKLKDSEIIVSLSEINFSISEKEKEISIINSNINNYNSDIVRLESEKGKETTIKEIIDAMNKNIAEYEDIQKLFGKDGIQKRQIQMLLGEIEVETNALIKKFFDNIGIKFGYDNKGIDLKILRRVDMNDGSFEQKEDVIGNFSDAQQEVLKVLLKLSFSKVVQNLNNTPLNILFLNETFNTLSKDKEPVLVDILNHYNRSYHISFITHNSDLIGNYGVNNIYDISE